MAGVVPIVPPRTGTMGGKLQVETDRFITFDELYANVPEIQSFFDELDKKKLRYLLVDSHGKVQLELDIEAAAYIWQSYEAPRGGFAYKLDFDFGRRLPRISLKKVLNVENCIINIRTAGLVRGLTLNLIAKDISYVHESLWASKNAKSAKEARDLFKVLQWLVDDKKFKISAQGGAKRFKELVTLTGGK